MPDSDSASPAARVALRPENIPSSLKSLRSWCVWKYEPRPTGKPAKHPYQPNGRSAKSNDAATWNTFDACLKAYQSGKFAGIGVFLARNLAGVDLDGCRDADGATPDAAEILGKFAGTYAEVSPSGAGYRCFCYGKPKRSGKNDGAVKWVEVYREPSWRFLSVTGHAIATAEVTEQQAALDWLHARYFAGASQPEAEPEATSQPDATNTPVFTSLSDAELIEKASQKPDFAALWDGDTSGHGGDASSADMALAGALAFWTNSDAAAMDRLFRLSGLFRDKWDSKRGDTTYGRVTIDKAVANCRSGYTGQRPDSDATSDTNEAGKGEHSGGGSGGAGSVPGGGAVPGGGSGVKEPGQWFTGATLLRTQFAEPSWLLPDILPDNGCYLLSGKPKAGKSWWAYALALAVAQGGKFLGRDVPQGKVLYLALEDTQRRLKARLLVLQPDGELTPDCLATLAMRTEAPRLGAGLEELLSAALERGGVTFVVADTLQKVRKLLGGQNQYQADYEAVSALKRLADTHNCVVLVVHHLRKEEAADIHDCVSGTLGLTGAADGSLILQRQRGDGAATLSVTGRDMDESEHGLRFERGLWTYAGTAVEVKASAEQNEVFEALRPYGGDGATANEVSSDTGKKGRIVRHHLGKLVDAGRVRVRHVKPAPRYAVCDGPGRDTTSVTTPPEREKGSANLIASVASVASVARVASVASHAETAVSGNPGNEKQPGVAMLAMGGNLDVASGNVDGKRVNATSGNAGNGGNADDRTWFEV